MSHAWYSPCMLATPHACLLLPHSRSTEVMIELNRASLVWRWRGRGRCRRCKRVGCWPGRRSIRRPKKKKFLSVTQLKASAPIGALRVQLSGRHPSCARMHSTLLLSGRHRSLFWNHHDLNVQTFILRRFHRVYLPILHKKIHRPTLPLILQRWFGHRGHRRHRRRQHERLDRPARGCRL